MFKFLLWAAVVRFRSPTTAVSVAYRRRRKYWQFVFRFSSALSKHPVRTEKKHNMENNAIAVPQLDQFVLAVRNLSNIGQYKLLT